MPRNIGPFVADDGETAESLFYKRGYYKYTAKSSRMSPQVLVDFNIGEKLLYGRVNYSYTPIVPFLEERALYPWAIPKRFKTSRLHDPKLPMSAFPFVVDAFEDVALQFDKALLQGTIRQTPHLTKLKIHAAYTQPERYYRDYMNNYMRASADYLTKNRRTAYVNVSLLIKDFIRDILPRMSDDYPISYPGFVKSTHCPPNVTGLVVDIANLPLYNDQEKISNFIQNPNWGFFMDVCRRHGFMIDQGVPFRMVANIDSRRDGSKSTMLEYAGRYGLDTTPKILASAYTPAYTRGFELFKEFLVKMYHLVSRPSYSITLPTQNGMQRSTLVESRTYTAADLVAELGEETLLSLFMQIRMQEEENEFDEYARKAYLEDALGMYRVAGISKALHMFAQLINSTYEYAGSMTDVVAKMQTAYGEDAIAGVGGATSKTSAKTAFGMLDPMQKGTGGGY